jgi:hypothetical protein
VRSAVATGVSPSDADAAVWMSALRYRERQLAGRIWSRRRLSVTEAASRHPFFASL